MRHDNRLNKYHTIVSEVSSFGDKTLCIRHGFRERKKTVFAEVFPCKLHAILFQKQLKQVETGF